MHVALAEVDEAEKTMVEPTANVAIATDSGICTIRLDNPPSNFLNPAIMTRLVDVLLEVDADEAVTAIMLTGTGDVFCGGMGVHIIEKSEQPEEFGIRLAELLSAMRTLGTPIAAAVNGDALASGASLACACDYAAMVPSARLGVTEVQAGAWPMLAQVPLIHRIGQRALENAASGEPFTARRACEVGAVNALVDRDELEDHVRAWLTNASRAGAMAARGRRAFYEMSELSYEQGLRRALDEFIEMFRQR